MAPIPISFDSISAAFSNLARRIPELPSPEASSLIDRNLTPTRTSSFLRRIIFSRQSANSVVPTTYGSINSGPDPGTVVGIVLGSVAGFLLLLWLFYTCLNFGAWGTASVYTEREVVRERDRRKSHHSSHRSRRASETVEIRRSSRVSPVRIVREPSPRREETIIVEEERREERRPPPRVRSVSRESDEIIVIEDHSPPRRKKSHRNRERERDDRESGYRTVDPNTISGVIGGSRRSSRRG
ncbi:hypothetical protein G7Y89_g12892 [Cudoniella acicularis]|uniref:Uncharacterized protein n=1 Tax=Cudoniella acicularis TaxID=354080 RepID=A0A8H4VZ78_9HELO|nr:hypothetical protein G7Y89_g12892 [Cudoniella acicularis]